MGAIIKLIISTLSEITTIIFGWKRFRDDILLKRIKIPVYAYLIVIFVVVLAFIFWPAIKDRPKPLRTIKGESFGVQRIIVDRKSFVNCKFRRTELVYMGGDCQLENCTLENIGLVFGGPANSTINTLTAMYADPGFRPFIEGTLKNIREGKLPEAVPPSDAADD